MVSGDELLVNIGYELPEISFETVSAIKMAHER